MTRRPPAVVTTSPCCSSPGLSHHPVPAPFRPGVGKGARDRTQIGLAEGTVGAGQPGREEGGEGTEHKHALRKGACSSSSLRRTGLGVPDPRRSGRRLCGISECTSSWRGEEDKKEDRKPKVFILQEQCSDRASFYKQMAFLSSGQDGEGWSCLDARKWA